MRWSTLVTLIVSFLLLGALAAPASSLGRRDEIANIGENQEANPTTRDPTNEASATATAAETQKDASITATDASTEAEATATNTNALTTGSTNATTTTTAASATSTVPSLDGATASSQREAADSKRPTYSGGLPIEPKITPAFGVGGFILMALGAVLAFIGVRKQWYVDDSKWATIYANLQQGSNLPLNCILDCLGSNCKWGMEFDEIHC